MLQCWAKFSNGLVHWRIRMISAKITKLCLNFKFVKVMPKMLWSLFSGHSVYVCLFFFTQLGCLWKSNPLSVITLAKHAVTIQGHSRSLILQSITGLQGIAYCHIVTTAFSKVFEEVATENAENCRCRQPTVVWRHLLEETPRTSVYTLYRYFPKRESLVHIFTADIVGLSSFEFLWLWFWAPKHESFLQYSA